jgi:hypothetical protein
MEILRGSLIAETILRCENEGRIDSLTCLADLRGQQAEAREAPVAGIRSNGDVQEATGPNNL